MPATKDIEAHYASQSVLARVKDALKNAGLGEGRLSWQDLAPLDQFHLRGVHATKELAAALRLDAQSRVLDIGCGLGGPARYLASAYGCTVTGVDLVPAFLEVAHFLNERTELSGHLTLVQGDALALPFQDASFDCAWTQHVAMNIADRETFLSEIARVLRPGGSLAIYDVLSGNGQPLLFPLPWASRPEESHLVFPDEMRTILTQAGFQMVVWETKSAACLEWLEARKKVSPRKDSSALALTAVMGERFPLLTSNLEQNLRDGRVEIVQAVFRKAERK